MSKAINSAAAALSASQNTNGRAREGQPSFFMFDYKESENLLKTSVLKLTA